MTAMQIIAIVARLVGYLAAPATGGVVLVSLPTRSGVYSHTGPLAIEDAAAVLAAYLRQDGLRVPAALTRLARGGVHAAERRMACHPEFGEDRVECLRARDARCARSRKEAAAL